MTTTETPCTCVDTLRGLDRAGCPRDDPDDAGAQWERDHPDGVISADEQDAMARYAYESHAEAQERG